MNELDAANAAPLASDSERSGAKMMLMYAIVLIVGFIAAIAVGVHFVKKYDANEQRVDSIKKAPVVSPEQVGYRKSHVPKIKPQVATNKIAAQAINTPATPSFSPEKAPKQPEPLTPAEQDFAKQLAIFERKL